MHRKAEEEPVAELPATTTTPRGAAWASRSRYAIFANGLSGQFGQERVSVRPGAHESGVAETGVERGLAAHAL